MNRRNFIQQTAALSSLVGLGGMAMSFAEDKAKHITILHTNDVHSHVEPLSPNDPKNPDMGGAARRATIIKNVRKENPNTLLFDAGDIFQGTPYFNFYGGEVEFKLMSMMKYDAATIGNHDFDDGIDGLYSQLPNAKFPFINSNYDFSDTVMDGHVLTHKIFQKNGVKIGVFGLGVELKGLVNDNLYKNTKYLDPVPVAKKMTRMLREEKKCDLVICLSHLGYKYDTDKISDLKLAQATSGIDLIIGGHTHTFLEKPTIETNAEGKKVLINQVGCYGLYLGRIDFFLDKNNNVENTNAVRISV
ncbi:MAG: metallophosphatase [Gillisia sp.]